MSNSRESTRTGIGLAALLILAACGEAATPVVQPARADPPMRLDAARIDVVDLRQDRPAPFIEAGLDPAPAAAAAAALRQRFAPGGAVGAVVFAIETAAVRATPVAAADSLAGVAATRHDGAIQLRATLQQPGRGAREARVEATRRLDTPNSWDDVQRREAVDAFVATLVDDLIAETEARLRADGVWAGGSWSKSRGR